MTCPAHLVVTLRLRERFEGWQPWKAFNVSLGILDGDWVPEAERGDLGRHTDHSNEACCPRKVVHSSIVRGLVGKAEQHTRENTLWDCPYVVEM